MKILISTHAPLDPVLGAGQMAINLHAALTRLGHDVTLWSPFPSISSVRPRLHSMAMRKMFKAYIAEQPAFDIVDIVPTLWNGALRKDSKTTVIARSVQPELLYRFLPPTKIIHPRQAEPWTHTLSELLTGMQNLEETVSILHCWKNVDRILCLGSLEREWMSKKFPYWAYKTTHYLNALAPSEQQDLAAVRLNRQTSPEGGTRFLWMGRWTSQKGNGVLHDFILQRQVQFPLDTFTIAGCGDRAQNYFPPALIDKRIFLLPRVERAAIPNLLKQHDVGLFTSVIEGWGLSLNEMLETGMPVYATTAGGIPDLYKVLPSLIFPFPPPDAIPPTLMPSAHAFKTYYETFNWDSIARQFMEAATKEKGQGPG